MLFNNAGIGLKGTSWEGLDHWHKLFEVNVFGCVSHPYLYSDPGPDDQPHMLMLMYHTCRIVNVQQTFAPSMIHQENQSVIINTGSKQGITNPPYAARSQSIPVLT